MSYARTTYVVRTQTADAETLSEERRFATLLRLILDYIYHEVWELLLLIGFIYFFTNITPLTWYYLHISVHCSIPSFSRSNPPPLVYLFVFYYYMCILLLFRLLILVSVLILLCRNVYAADLAAGVSCAGKVTIARIAPLRQEASVLKSLLASMRHTTLVTLLVTRSEIVQLTLARLLDPRLVKPTATAVPTFTEMQKT